VELNLITKLVVSIAICFSLNSCTKAEGEGGTANIRGRIYAKYYNKSVTTLYEEKYAPKENVYIIYGDAVTYGNDQDSNYDGYYEFKYLRPGKYKIYAYSRDTTGASVGLVNQYAPPIAIVQEIEITKSGETVNVPDISIIK